MIKKRGKLVARFWGLKQDGRTVPKRDLCNLDELEFKTTKRGQVKRTEKEQEKLKFELYSKAYKTILEQQTKEKAENKPSALIGDLMQRFLDSINRTHNPKTVTHYTKALSYYIEILGNHRLSEFPDDYKSKLIESLSTQMSVNSVRAYLAEIQRFFNWLYEEDLIEKPVKLKKPAPEKKTPELYDMDDLKTIEQHLRNKIKTSGHGRHRRGYINQLRVLILAKETAMRRGEIWALPLNHIDLDKRTITIKSVPALAWTPKGKKDAVLPISSALYTFLKNDPRGDKEVYYLDNGTGAHWYTDIKAMTRAFSRILKELNLPAIKPLHSIRRTILTSVTASHGLAVAGALARHESLQTTLTHYVNNDKLKVADALEGLH